MPLGIDWDKVNEREDARLATLKPAPKMTRVTPEEPPKTRRRRNSSAPSIKEPAEVTARVSAQVQGEQEETPDPNEGIDTEPENEDGEKV